MTSCWQLLATVALLGLPMARSFNPFQGSSDRVFHPMEDPDPFLDNFKFFDEDKEESHKLPLPQPVGASEDVNNQEVGLSENAPKFDISTFTFNEENFRKTDDIFSLLADVEDTKYVKSDKYSQVKQQGIVTPSKKKATSGSIGIPGVEAANGFSKEILLATKKVEDLLSIVQRMKKKVDAKVGSNSPTSSSSSTLSSSSSSSSSNDSSPLANLLLNASELEEIQKAVVTSKTEEEFLDHLTSVLIGAETRQGSALTLDPVTVIALLTLAAYLIRAVYQILTVTGRSVDVDDMLVPLQLSDLPDAMANIHNWISSSDVALVREGRAVHDLGSILDIPGNLAAIIKLQREGHRPCVRQFLCEQLERRTLPEITLTDIFVSALGFYFGDTDMATFIDSTLSSRSSCDILPEGCSPYTLRDAHYLEDLYTRVSYKFFHFLFTVNNYL